MFGVFRPAPAGSWIDLPAHAPATGDPFTARDARAASLSRPWRAARAASGRRALDGRARAGAPVLVVAAAAALVTLVVSALPLVRFAYYSPAAHLAIDTASSVIAVLVAALLWLRFRRTGQPRDLVLVAALATLALANLAFSVLPALSAVGHEPMWTWALLASRLLGAALMAAACLAPHVRLRAPGRTAAWLLAACVGTIAAVGALLALLEPGLPVAVDPARVAAQSGRPTLDGHAAVLAGQLVGMLLFAAAAMGFARRAETPRDGLMRWLAAGAVLAGFARLNYFLYPSLFSDFLYTGDFFNLAFYLVLLVGALREIETYHRGMTEAAVLQERRRIARDLHDGVAQDVAFIASRIGGLDRAHLGDLPLDHLRSAAHRALDDSRAAIAALTRPLDEPLAAALERNATEVAERLGGRAELALEDGIAVAPATREALVRIVREATANAVRHGRAGRIAVSLTGGDAVRLTIADDGCGFDAAATDGRRATGFGLVSMTERAEALGGGLAVASAPGAGTTIEVVVPCPGR